MNLNHSNYGKLRINNDYVKSLELIILIGRYVKFLIVVAFFEVLTLLIPGVFFLIATTPVLSITLYIIVALILTFLWCKSDMNSSLNGEVKTIKSLLQKYGIRAVNNNPKELMYRDIVNEMSIATNLPVPKAYIIDSDTYNALCISNLHYKKRKYVGISYIVVTSAMLNRFSRNQLECVIGDELARIASGDVLANLLVTHLLITLHVRYENIMIDLFFDYFVYDENALGETDLDNDVYRDIPLGWLICILRYLIYLPILSLICHFVIKFSHNRDYNADLGSVQLNNDPNNLIQALQLCANSPSLNTTDVYINNLYFVANHVVFTEHELDKYHGINPSCPKFGLHHVNQLILNALNSHTTLQQRINYINHLNY